MSCGNLFVQDPSSAFWVVSVADNGVILVTKSTTVLIGFVPPTLASTSFTWQLSALVDGTLTATQIAPTSSPTSVTLTSINSIGWNLAIDDSGNFFQTLVGTVVPGLVPFPSGVRMSQWPQNIGLTSTVAGATPLTISADFSIWSCLLNKFINEDTTNIIVVLEE